MGNTNLCLRWIANEPNRLARILIKLTEQYNVNEKVQIIDAHSKSYVFVLYWVFSSAVDQRKQSNVQALVHVNTEQRWPMEGREKGVGNVPLL